MRRVIFVVTTPRYRRVEYVAVRMVDTIRRRVIIIMVGLYHTASKIKSLE